MSKGGMISIEASKLREAMAIAVPKVRGRLVKLKPAPISIFFDDNRSMLLVQEAKYGVKGHEVPASGHWPKRVQIDGRKLQPLVEKLKLNVLVSLAAMPDSLHVQSGSFKISFPRIDAVGKPGIEETNFPKNSRHRGPIEIHPDPTERRVELDATWGFTARMPVPQHRKPKE